MERIFFYCVSPSSARGEIILWNLMKSHTASITLSSILVTLIQQKNRVAIKWMPTINMKSVAICLKPLPLSATQGIGYSSIWKWRVLASACCYGATSQCGVIYRLTVDYQCCCSLGWWIIVYRCNPVWMANHARPSYPSIELGIVFLVDNAFGSSHQIVIVLWVR